MRDHSDRKSLKTCKWEVIEGGFLEMKQMEAFTTGDTAKLDTQEDLKMSLKVTLWAKEVRVRRHNGSKDTMLVRTTLVRVCSLQDVLSTAVGRISTGAQG